MVERIEFDLRLSEDGPNLFWPVFWTCFWFVVGGILPWLVPKGENRGITQTCLVTTAVCLWMLWATTYMVQMNPLFGPLINNATLTLIQKDGF